MAKDTFYFSHDYNARNDIKIRKLLTVHGLLGYGAYWAIVEELYNNANALPTDYDCIAYALRAEKILIESVIKDFDLFVFDGELFGSTSVERRLNERIKKSKKASLSAYSRWNKCERNANALQSDCEGNARKERKEKEIKGKDIKNSENQIPEPLPINPDQELIDRMLNQFDRIEMIQRNNDVSESVVKKWIPKFIQHLSDNNTEHPTNAKIWNHFEAWFKIDYKNHLNLEKAKGNGTVATKVTLPGKPVIR